MAKIMDPILPIVSILAYGAIILGSFGGPGTWSPGDMVPATSRSVPARRTRCSRLSL